MEKFRLFQIFRKLKYLPHIIISFLSGILLIILLILGLATTSPGFKLLNYGLSPVLKNYGIHYKPSNLSGSLYHFSLKKLIIQKPSQKLEFKSIAINWSPWSLLFNNTLKIKNIHIQKLSIYQNSKSKKSKKPKNNIQNSHNISWSDSIELPNFKINSIDYIQNHHIYFLGQLNTALHISHHNFLLEHLSLSGGLGYIHGHIHLNLSKQHPSSQGNLVWIFKFPNHILSVGHLRLSGQLSAVHFYLESALKKDGLTTHLRTAITANLANPKNRSIKIESLTLLEPHSGKLSITANLNWPRQYSLFNPNNFSYLNTHLNTQIHFDFSQFNAAPFWPLFKKPITAQIAIQKNNHKLNIHIQSHTHHLSIQYHANFVNQKWIGLISQLNWSGWALKHTAHLNFSPTPSLSKFCIYKSKSSLCANIQNKSTQINTSKKIILKLTGYNLISQLPEFLNIPLIFKGGSHLVFTAHTQYNPLKPFYQNFQNLNKLKNLQNNLQFQLKWITHQFTISPLNSHQMTIPIGKSSLDLNYKNSLLSSAIHIPKAAMGHLISNIQIHFPKNILSNNLPNNLSHTFAKLKTAQTTGDLKLNWNKLSVLNKLSNNLFQIAGKIKGNIIFSGPFNHLKFKGAISGKSLNATIPTLGILLKNGHFTAQPSPNSKYSQGLNLSAQFSSGKGDLNLKGQINLKQSKLKITGQNFTLFNLPWGSIVASPNLIFTQNGKLSNLTGSLFLPKAFISGNNFHSTQTQSPDVIIINPAGEPESKKHHLPFSTHIKITLGKNVVYQGFGILTHIIGNAELTSKPHQSFIVNGTLSSVNGSYQSYGHRFTITTGHMLFTNSPIENPGLNITAVYQLNPTGQSNHLLNKLTVGVKMTGTLQHRILTLFSTPPLSQENILSYIVLGEPLSQIQQSDQSALSKAAALFVLQGGQNSLFENIQHKLGLNQLTIGSLNQTAHSFGNIPINNNSNPSQTNNTAIFIGKSLSPNIFISYGIGLFNRQQEASLSLILGKHWVMKTTGSSQDSGVDFIYNILRN